MHQVEILQLLSRLVCTMNVFRLAVALLVGFSVSVVNGDFLNEFFDDKVFGKNPGPCPDTNNRCRVNLDPTNFPQSIKDINVCIIEFNIPLIGKRGFCDTIGNWVRGGEAEIWDLTCKKISVDNNNGLSLTPQGTYTNTFTETRFAARNVIQECDGAFQLYNVQLQTDIPTLLKPAFLFADHLIITVSGPGTFTTRPGKNGVDLQFDFQVTSPGFDTTLPQTIFIPENDCSIDLGLGLSLNLPGSTFDDVRIGTELGSIDLSFVLRQGFINVFVVIVEAFFAGVVCQVISQAAFLDGGGPGLVNVLLDDALAIYDDNSNGVPENINVVHGQFLSQPQTFPGMDAIKLADSVNFITSTAFSLLSVSLNDWLGSDINGNGKLVVNDAIELLLGENGDFEFDLEREGLNLRAVLPIKITDAEVAIKQLSASELNSISEFNILLNDFSGSKLEHALKHGFAIDQFSFIGDFSILLKRGEWVTKSSCGSLGSFNPSCLSDQEELTFRVSLAVENVDFSATTLIAANPEELNDVQLGQIFDQDFVNEGLSAVKAAVQCAAPALYQFNFTSLSALVGSVTTVNLDSISDGGLFNLVQQGTDLGLHLLRSILEQDLPGILQGPVRQLLNDFLTTYVTNYEGPTICPDYVQTPSADPYFNFNSRISEAVFEVVNSVLGNPQAGTSADINDLIQVLLEYASDGIDIFPLLPTATQGSWVSKPAFQNLIRLEAFRGNNFPSGVAEMKISDLTIENVNSIETLSASALGQNGLSASFGFRNSNPLSISLTFVVDVDSLGINERFDVITQLKGLDLQVSFSELLVNVDDILRLKFGQLTHIPCITGVLDKMVVSSESLTIDSLDVDLVRSQSSNTPIGQAIGPLADELNSDNTPRFDAMLNTILKNSFTQFWNIAAEKVQSGTSSPPEACSDEEDPLKNFLDVLFGITIPDVTALVEQCIATPELALPPAEAEARIQNIDLENDNYLDFVKLGQFMDLFSSISAGAAAQQVLRVFANTTGNPISDILTLEEDNSVSLDIVLNEPNFFFDLVGFPGFTFQDDRIIPGLDFQAERLKIRKIEKLVEDLSFLNPQSTFVTSYHVGIPSGNPLDAEVSGFIETDDSFIGHNAGETIREEFSLTFQMDDFSFDMDLLLAIDIDKFLLLKLGHLLNVTEDQFIIVNGFAASCLLATIYENGLHIPSLRVSVGSIDNTGFTTTGNLVSTAAQGVVNEAIHLISQFYVEALPNIFQNCIRSFINDLLDRTWNYAVNSDPDVVCPKEPQLTDLSPEQTFFRFSTSGANAQLQSFLNDFLFANDYNLWNTFMQSLTASTLFPDNPISTGRTKISYQGRNYGSIDLAFRNLLITNLNTFSFVEFLAPKATTSTDNRRVLNGDYRHLQSEDDFVTDSGLRIDGPLNVKVDLDIRVYDLFPEFPEYVNDVRLNVGLYSIFFLLDLFLKVNIPDALDTRFKSVSSLQQIPCILASVEDISFLDFVFNISGIDLEVQCNTRCDAPPLARLGNTKLNFNNGDEVTGIINDLVDYLNDYLQSETWQDALDTQVAFADITCDSFFCVLDGSCRTASLGDDEVFKVFGSFFGACFAFFGTTVWLLIPVHKRRREKALQGIKDGRASVIFENKQHDLALSPNDQIKILEKDMVSLFSHPRVGKITKLIIPTFCAINVVCLIVSIGFSDAMHVNAYFSLFTVQSTELTLVDFSMTKLIDDLWNSGAWLLSLVLVVASCIWPVVKNILLFLIWFTPTTILSSRTRYKVLQALDYLGKWSLLEAFIIVVAVAGVQTSLDISQQARLGFLTSNFFQLEVNLTVERGITLQAYVAFASLFLNHVITSFHHKAERYNHEIEDRLRHQITSPPKQALTRIKISTYTFVGRTKTGERPKISAKAVRIITFASGLGFFLVLLGLFLPVVTFTVTGVVGRLMREIDAEYAQREFSVAEIGAQVGKGTKRDVAAEMASYFFQVLFFVSCVIAPLLQTPFNLVLLHSRFTLRDLKTFQWGTQIVAYWAAIECILVGLVGLAWQAQVIVEYVADLVTDDICSNIKSVLETLAVNAEDAICIELRPSLDIATVPLVFGIGINTFCTFTILVISSAVSQDRYFKAYHGLRHDSKPEKPGFVRRKLLSKITIRTGHYVDADKRVSNHLQNKNGESEKTRTSPNPMFQSSNLTFARSDPPREKLGKSEGTKNPLERRFDPATRPSTGQQPPNARRTRKYFPRPRANTQDIESADIDV